jgi:hypothetical protein
MSVGHSWSLDWLDLFSHLHYDPWFMGMPSHGLEQGGAEGDGEAEKRGTKLGGKCKKRGPSAISEQ